MTTTDNRTPEEIAYDAVALSRPRDTAQPFDIQAMIAEVNRRLDDPNRPPFALAIHPLAPEKIEDTQALFGLLEENHQTRLLNIFEKIMCLPEDEMERAFDFMLITFEVAEEMAA